MILLSVTNQVLKSALPSAGGLILGTRVMTKDGEIPVEYLCVGDQILTRAGLRKLAHVSCRVERAVKIVRIAAGTLGHDRPRDETVLPTDQMVLIRDWRAKALYGADQVLVAASRLADGEMIRIETANEVRVFILAFDANVVIYAGGLEVGCLPEAVTA